MPLELEANFDTEKLDKFLDNLQERVNLEKPEIKQKLAEKLQEVLFEDLKLRFASSPPTILGGVVYGNVNWDALSHSYLKSRPERAEGKIYIDTGALKNSLVSVNTNNISSFRDSTYTFGTRIPYAEKLQKKRKIVFWHPELLKKVSEVFADFALEE